MTQVTFNAASRYGIAVSALADACAFAEKAKSDLGARGTEAFAAILAADHGTSAKTASGRISDDIPASKTPGHSFGPVRSRCVAFFSDSANLAALRAAIPSPEGMTPEAFQEAVVAYAETVNVRKWYDDRAAAKKAAATASAEAAATATREPGDDEKTGLDTTVETSPVPERDPLLDARTEAMRAIANLREMLRNVDEAVVIAATETLLDIGAAVETALASVEEVARTGTEG